MRISDTVIGLVIILFGGAVLTYTRSFPSLENGYPGPSLFPNILAVLFILAGIVLVVQGVRSRETFLEFDTSGISQGGFANILLVLAAIVFYILLSDFLGFQITSFILLFSLMKWLRVSTLWCLLMSVVITEAIYILFAKMLLVALPWGIVGW